MTHSVRILLSIGTLFASAIGLQAAAEDLPPAALPVREVAPTDQARFARLVLDNGLRVLLVSDPTFNKSAASLVVDTGQIEDPADTPGLAHFTEHMLFLGTEKFPDEGEYGTFVKRNGGYTNAYTSSDRTNFQFEVRHEALDATLDRFAQFFIAPLFTPTFTAREVNAVHNEVMRHVQNDGRRIFNVKRELFAAGSPESRFGAGNQATLAHADSATVRAFFESHYSADRMALAVAGAAPLAELEAMARRHFAAIPNRHLGAPVRPQTFLPRVTALRLAQVEPIQDVRQLELEFPLAATRARCGAKNDELIATLLSHTNPGGLEAALKDAGLALSAGGGLWDRCADYSSLFISVSLTPAGAERLPAVFDLIFGYLDFLRQTPFPTSLWQESAQIAALNETYNDRGEGAALVTELANQALFFPLELAERAPHLWVSPDEADYRHILEQLTPDNFLAVFTARGVPTDRTEHFYGTAYSYAEDRGDAYRRLLSAAAPADHPFALPRPNPYLPRHPRLLTERPVRLTREPGLTLFYAPDLEFRRPQTTLQLRYVPAAGGGDARTAALLALFDACLGDALNETAGEAARAGVSFQVSVGLAALQLTVSGFGDSPVSFARGVVSHLGTIAPSADRFADLKDGYLRSLRSFPETEAFRLASARRGAWTHDLSFLPTELLPPAETASWPEVAAAARTFFARGTLEGVIHGHLAPETALATARVIKADLGFTPVDESDLLRPRELVMNTGETLIEVAPTAGANSAYSAEYLLPDADARHRAAAAVLGNFMAQPFFNELRTHQQLGYIVGAGASGSRRTRALYFVIQSSTHAPDDLRTRAETFIATLPAQLAALPADDFATLVAGARANLEEKPKSIADKTARFFSAAFDYDQDWTRTDDAVTALETLTQSDLVALARTVLDPRSARLRLVLLNGTDHPPSTATPTFTDRESWQASRRYD